MNRSCIPVAVATLLLTTVGHAADDAYNLTGSVKNLFTASETPVAGDSYWSDLTRLKLDFDARLTEALRFKAVVDNEFLIGSLLDTDEFQLVRDFGSNTRWDMDTLVVDNDDLVWRASVYRVYLKLALDKTNIVAGRQRIAWGTGRIWNPTDLFNPISPLQIERSQRDGIDGLSLEYFAGALSSVNVVYALGEDSDKNSLAARGGGNVSGYDIGLMAGEFRGDKVVGFDFAGNIGDAGFRGEATYTDPESGSRFTRAVVGVDYTWPNTVYLLVEYLYNGGNLKDSGLPDGLIEARERFFDGEIVTLNKNFLATGLGYELTPLLRFDGLAILDIDGSSWFLTPTLRWNARTNLDLAIGVQVFTGDADTEYGDNADVLYGSFQVYF